MNSKCTRSAAVVGVGPGLGAAVARRFAREGYAVGLMSRTAGTSDPVAASIREAGGTAEVFQVDAAEAASVAAGFAAMRESLGSPEVLVYNAGAFKIAGILDVSPEDFETCWKVTCAGAFHAGQQVLPGMLECGRGTVIFTGATAALRGSARFSCLAVGKFGLRALAQSMARELGPRGVHVAHVVIDGMIDTERVRSFAGDRPAGSLLSPDSIAEAYWALHAQDPSAWTLEMDLRPSVEKF